MKARIKKTGEIVNLAEYAKITLDMCDSYGNPIELKPDEVELIDNDKETNSPMTDWNQVRIQAAIAAMQGIISNAHKTDYRHGTYCEYKDGCSDIAKQSVWYADALIKELKNNKYE